ncbi:MAG: HAD-IA family hydrolase [Candidatus Omnitrophica bacterium]|nr:HAD-IA family hydrolase [Candidatus Omnitrophota bacterium]
MKYKLIIVDLGNVLINFNHWIAANKLLKYSSKSLDAIHTLFFDSPTLKDFEEGKMTPEDFFLAVKEDLGLDIDYERFLPIWNDIFYLTPDNLAVHKLLSTLKTQYKIVLLSNINQLHFEYLQNNFNIFDPFNRLVLSYKIGLRKPAPEIYRHALDLFSVRPEQAFYIDDRDDLIAAAKLLSIPAVVFKSFPPLMSALHDAGIIKQEKKALPA